MMRACRRDRDGAIANMAQAGIAGTARGRLQDAADNRALCADRPRSQDFERRRGPACGRSAPVALMARVDTMSAIAEASAQMAVGSRSRLFDGVAGSDPNADYSATDDPRPERVGRIGGQGFRRS